MEQQHKMLTPLDFKTLGQFLRFRRRMYGFTQKEMGAALGVSYQQYQKYEYDLIKPLTKNADGLSEKLRINKLFIPTLAAKDRF